jgi:hypothetical protein
MPDSSRAAAPPVRGCAKALGYNSHAATFAAAAAQQLIATGAKHAGP